MAKKSKTPKANALALARRDRKLMECLLPDTDDMVTVSIDLGAGEPTVTSHFSQDANYRYACFDGVGKAPYVNRDGVLMIDDIYLMTASISPLGAKVIKDALNTKWNGLSFAEQWLIDAEVIKSALKKPRQFHKMGALGWSYGMGAKKFCSQAYDAGFIVSLSDSRAFKTAYWQLFSDVKRFSDRISRQIEIDGHVVNPFGYRLTPEPHKGFNAFIQSSVSGIMHVFAAKLMALAGDYANYKACIHDELLIDVPRSMIETFRQHKELATESLNDDLKWSVKIRTGFAVGNNWYEAK